MNALVTQALQQALIASARDDSLRWRAISALRGAEVYAATWAGDPTQLRTLVDPEGTQALAVFSDERHLEEAALRLAWVGVDGAVPMRRLHISDAIRFTRGQGISVLVVDFGSDHAFELDEGDLELVAAPPSTRPGSYGALAPVLSSARDDVTSVTRISTRPPPLPVDRDSSIPPASALRPTAVNVDVAHGAVSATFVPSARVTMSALDAPPGDDVTDALAQALRDYPAVEWACLVADADRPAPATFDVALRIDPAFRQQLPEIRERLREVSTSLGQHCDAVMLETAEQMKRARQIGLPFYPWRRR